MPVVKHLNGQSNIDICLYAIGSIDKIINFCKNNNVKRLSETVTNYSWSNNDILNRKNCGYPYISLYLDNNIYGFVTEYSDELNVYYFCMEDNEDEIFVKENNK